MFDRLLAKEAENYFPAMTHRFIRTDYKPTTVHEYVFQLYMKDFKSGMVRHRMAFYGIE